jgi:hypothetical protein
MARLWAGQSGVQILAGTRDLFSKMSKPALGPTHLPVELVLGAVSLGVKRPECEANYCPPSSAEVKFEWSYTSTLPAWLILGQLCLYLEYFGVNFMLSVI